MWGRLVRSRRCGTKHIAGVLRSGGWKGQKHCPAGLATAVAAVLTASRRKFRQQADQLWAPRRWELHFTCTVGQVSLWQSMWTCWVHRESEGNCWPRCMLLCFSWWSCGRGICKVLEFASDGAGLCFGRDRGQYTPARR